MTPSPWNSHFPHLLMNKTMEYSRVCGILTPFDGCLWWLQGGFSSCDLGDCPSPSSCFPTTRPGGPGGSWMMGLWFISRMAYWKCWDFSRFSTPKRGLPENWFEGAALLFRAQRFQWMWMTEWRMSDVKKMVFIWERIYANLPSPQTTTSKQPTFGGKFWYYEFWKLQWYLIQI